MNEATPETAVRETELPTAYVWTSDFTIKRVYAGYNKKA